MHGVTMKFNRNPVDAWCNHEVYVLPSFQDPEALWSHHQNTRFLMKNCGEEVGSNVRWFYCEVNKQERIPSLVIAPSYAAWGQGHSVPQTENHISIHLYPRKLHSHCLESWGLDLQVAADDAGGSPSALELWTKTGRNNQHHSYYILQHQVIRTLQRCVAFLEGQKSSVTTNKWAQGTIQLPHK